MGGQSVHDIALELYHQKTRFSLPIKEVEQVIRDVIRKDGGE
jgi:hypothetical protein